MKWELLPQNGNSSPKRLKKHEKMRQKQKVCIPERICFFSQGQISPFYKIMLKMRLFLEKMIEKTPSKQNQLMLE